MEKYSAFRDPGTGVQPFLTPVPPIGSDASTKLLIPLGLILGAIRTLLVLVLALLYLVIVQGLCLVFTPIPPLHRAVTHIFTALLARSVLLIVGLFWIPVEVVTKRRGKSTKTDRRWNPRAGDIIISNWVSWIEILWLAFRYNPIFVLPIPASLPSTSLPTSAPTTQTPGRRTGTGSAAISSPSSRAPTPRIPIAGFKQVSLLSIVHLTGHVPSYGFSEDDTTESLDEILKKADRPVVLFPECTTSNGRGLLRFADVLPHDQASHKIFLMCVRYDPPTGVSPSLTHSIPATPVFLNPLRHILAISTSILPLAISIRLLPTSNLDALVSASEVEDVIASVGKMKKLGMGWEDKTAFLNFYWGTGKTKR